MMISDQRNLNIEPIPVGVPLEVRRADAERVLASVPPSDLLGRGAALSVLGDTAREAGDLSSARAYYDEALHLRRRLAEADPANAESQRDIARCEFDELLARHPLAFAHHVADFNGDSHAHE